MAKILWASAEIYFERPFIDYLEENGHEVITTQSTLNFYSKMTTQNTNYDLVIASCVLEADNDLTIPMGTTNIGLAAVQNLLEQKVEIPPVIFLSTSLLEKLEIKRSSLPVSYQIVVLPIRPNKFLELIEEILMKEGQNAP